MRFSGRTLAGALTAVVLLGACGGTDFNQANGRPTADPGARAAVGGTSGAQATLLRAVSSTTDAKTARVAMTFSFSGVSWHATGALRFDTVALSLSMTDSPAGDIDERLIGDTMYMHVDALTTVYGKPWISFDMKKLLGTSMSSLANAQQSQQDPSQYLAYLAGASDDAHEVGAEVVRGTETTRYHATIEMDRALSNSQIPQGLRDKLRQLGASLAGVTIPTDVWLDAQNRVRKMTIEMPLDQISNGAASGTMSIEEEFFDFGAPVSVSAPPSDQVHPIDDLRDLANG